MPEIIEIREYADLISKYTRNKNIINVKIHKGRYKKHEPFSGFNYLRKKLPLCIINVKTKGKFLYFILNLNIFIFNTCGLSGGWCIRDNNSNSLFFANHIKNSDYIKDIKKHLNVEFIFEDNLSLFFYDMLSFGTLKVVNKITILEHKLNTIGPDVMEKTTTINIFRDCLLHPKNLEKEIGIVLMDQSVISGIGNYLRSEILYLSKIHPFRKVNKLTRMDIMQIYKHTKMLTWGQYNKKKAIQYGYLNNKTKLAKDHQQIFFVYKQKKDIYGNIVTMKELYQGSQKRFIYYVPSIQK